MSSQIMLNILLWVVNYRQYDKYSVCFHICLPVFFNRWYFLVCPFHPAAGSMNESPPFITNVRALLLSVKYRPSACGNKWSATETRKKKHHSCFLFCFCFLFLFLFVLKKQALHMEKAPKNINESASHWGDHWMFILYELFNEMVAVLLTVLHIHSFI